MKKASSILIAMVLVASPGHAQVVVHDTAVTLRNAITASLDERLVDLQTSQHSQLRRMAQRLSLFTELGKYRAPDAPKWRTHPRDDGEGANIADAFQAALDFGDVTGDSYLGVTDGVADPSELLNSLPSAARKLLEQQLATIELTDAINIATVQNTGRLRFGGRAELQAIETLERDVTNGSLEQSATAVLDKVSGASLIAARQRQARTELMIGLVEQLAADTKRDRDTQAAALNMQLANWRNSEASGARFYAGTGQALGAWRQP